MTTYFENLTIKLYFIYILKKQVKFHVNKIKGFFFMLFTIRFINLFLCIILDYKNSKFKIDGIVIYL